MTPSSRKSIEIRVLNDCLRRTFVGGDVIVTDGVLDRDVTFRAGVMKAVREFDRFTEANDPLGEHDFGAFDVDGVQLVWTIDYYDTDIGFDSPDPADPVVTRRVLTILLAEEY